MKKSLDVSVRGKNDFAEGKTKILNTDLKIILLDHQNNFGTNIEQCCKTF